LLKQFILITVFKIKENSNEKVASCSIQLATVAPAFLSAIRSSQWSDARDNNHEWSRPRERCKWTPSVGRVWTRQAYIAAACWRRSVDFIDYIAYAIDVVDDDNALVLSDATQLQQQQQKI